MFQLRRANRKKTRRILYEASQFTFDFLYSNKQLEYEVKETRYICTHTQCGFVVALHYL